MFSFILPTALSYFVGALPTGYLFARFFFGIDITKNGSGNIGATNVARVIGCKKYFFLIFFLDFLKAFLALALLAPVCKGVLLACASMLLVGNCFSIFLKFRGGKGVSTTLGILAFLFPKILFGFLVIWILILLISRKVGIASLVATLSILPQYFLLFYTRDILTILFLIFIIVIVFLRHNNNIKNYLK